MNHPFERRSTESPMDFQYASEERNVVPIWSRSHDPAEPPRKRTHYEMNSSGRPPAFSTPPPARTFPFAETPSNTPFLFHPPASITPPPAEFWKLPQDFSPEKAFPPVVEPADVSMNDVTSNPGSVKKESKKDASTDAEDAGAVILARKVSTNAVKRVIKGRRRAHNRIANRSVERADEQGSESETEDEGYTRESSINHHYTFNIPGLPVDRSELPYMLLGYVQFFFNLSLVMIFLYLVVHLIINVQSDVEHRIEEYRAGLREKVATCAQMYELNRCSPIDQRVPALAQPCTEWELCMQRDPNVVGRARVVAETVGEIVDSFVEPISWKTLIFSVTSLAFLIAFINVLFSFYRARMAPEHYAHPSVPPPVPHFPTTPVRSRIAPARFSPGYHPVPPIDWGRTWSGTEVPIQASPTKQRQRRLREKHD